MGNGVDGECRDAAKVEFVADVLAVGNDRRQGDAQTVGNFLVDETADDQPA